MRFGQPDRVPYFQEGIRPDVLTAGAGRACVLRDLSRLFPIDGARKRISMVPHPLPALADLD